jgi:hypothetical protein
MRCGVYLKIDLNYYLGMSVVKKSCCSIDMNTRVE